MKRTIRFSLLLLAMLGASFAPVAQSLAAEIKARFYPLTGEVRLHNEGATPLDFVFYSITSDTGALNGADDVWKSISDTYDASGNGFIDPDDQWMKLSESPFQLSEAEFLGNGGTLLPQRSISLGNIWNAVAPPEPGIQVQIGRADIVVSDIEIEIALDGDYNHDLRVNDLDYNLWKVLFGFTTIGFADGNLDGIVDAADYIVWRDNRGNSLVGTEFFSDMPPALAAGAATIVPEPGAATLLIVSLFAIAMCGRGVCARPRYSIRDSTAR